MIEKDSGSYFLVCDVCGDSEGPFDCFQDAVDFKKDKENGWRSIKLKDGGWEERCPGCVNSGEE